MFAMMPFDLSARDLDAYEDEVVASVAGAVKDAGVPRVVLLSSGGADLPAGTGPIKGLYKMEQALGATGTRLTALRSGHFQEKVGDLMETAVREGVYPVFAGDADSPTPMVATRDIAEIAADALLHPAGAGEAVDIVGPSYTEREVASVLADALGRHLRVVTIPENEWVDALSEAGFAPNIASSLAELYGADALGRLGPRGDRRVQATTELSATIRSVVAESVS